jgi:nuclear transcription factor Y gamma
MEASGGAGASSKGASSSGSALGTLLLPGADALARCTAFLGTDEDPSSLDMEKALKSYWQEEEERSMALVNASSLEAAEVFKNANDLPLARIKRIMKSDEDVRMISAEAPVLFAKACELFISDLTIRSYAYTSEDRGKRRTLTREDVCLAVQQTDVFDFLVSVLMPGAFQGLGPAENGGRRGGEGGGAKKAFSPRFPLAPLPPPLPPSPFSLCWANQPQPPRSLKHHPPRRRHKAAVPTGGRGCRCGHATGGGESHVQHGAPSARPSSRPTRPSPRALLQQQQQ